MKILRKGSPAPEVFGRQVFKAGQLIFREGRLNERADGGEPKRKDHQQRPVLAYHAVLLMPRLRAAFPGAGCGALNSYPAKLLAGPHAMQAQTNSRYRGKSVRSQWVVRLDDNGVAVLGAVQADEFQLIFRH